MFWLCCFAVGEEAPRSLMVPGAQPSAAFLFWRGSEKFPPHVLQHSNAQVSVPIQELPVMSAQWASERSFQLCQELFHFVRKQEGEKKSCKTLKCWWCKNWSKGIATGKTERKVEAEEGTRKQDGKLLSEALRLFGTLHPVLILRERWWAGWESWPSLHQPCCGKRWLPSRTEWQRQ